MMTATNLRMYLWRGYSFLQVVAHSQEQGVISAFCIFYFYFLELLYVLKMNSKKFSGNFTDLVFQRFRQHKIFLKPNKCYLGYSEIDYVGKVLSAEGLKMSQEKIRQVLDFPKPDIYNNLKVF